MQNHEVALKWKAGELVTTVSLGGISPMYEQAIQTLLFEVFCDAKDIVLEVEGNVSPEFNGLVDRTVARLEKVIGYGYSGAQVGQARTTAFQFLKFGYQVMIDKEEVKDRQIFVTLPKELSKNEFKYPLPEDLVKTQSTDAMAWANSFCRTTREMDKEKIVDPGYMVGWFANAIMCALDSKKES